MLDEHIKSFTYADLFTKKYILRTTTACFAQIWQQLTGMNTLMYYIVYVFQMAGYEGNANLIASSIKYCLNTSIAIPALYLMDKIGRRPVLLTGTALMMAWRYAIGGLLATYSIPQPINETVRISIPPENSEAATSAITCCYLFVVSFACSWGVCIWVYCAEVWGDSASRQRRAALTTLLTGFSILLLLCLHLMLSKVLLGKLIWFLVLFVLVCLSMFSFSFLKLNVRDWRGLVKYGKKVYLLGGLPHGN